VRKKQLVSTFLLVAVLSLASRTALGQVYGYTDESGNLILSNIPSDPNMRLIAEGNPEAAGRIWRYSGQYDALILKAASLARLDSALIKAVIAIESGFNRFARSHKGAMGLMQLMPDTARRYGVVNPYDAWQNIKAGSIHLRDLIDEFNDLHLSLAAYNAGATPVRRYKTIPPYRETRDYVRKVMAIYRAGSKISITKGGQTYTINGKGAKTAVKPAPLVNNSSGTKTVRRTSWDDNMSLGEIAAATRRAAEPPSQPIAVAETPASTPKTSSNPAPPQAAEGSDWSEPEAFSLARPKDNGGDGPAFYRYTDANGVIYITRTKPNHEDYEVLKR
jgi:hypothetical protein